MSGGVLEQGEAEVLMKSCNQQAAHLKVLSEVADFFSPIHGLFMALFIVQTKSDRKQGEGERRDDM